MNGSLPPSSSTTFLISLPAMDATDDPAGPDPVSVAAMTRRSRRIGSTRAEPTSRVWKVPGGKPGPGEQVLDEQGGLRHVRCVLQQPDVAGHQGGGGEAHHLPEREIPRHDGQDRPERLIADVGVLGAHSAGVARLVGEVPGGVLGVIPAGAGALGDLLPGGGQRLAHLGGHHGRDLVLLLIQDAGCAVHPPGPFGKTSQAVACVRRRRGGQAALDLRLAHLVKGLQGLPGRGVDGRDRHGVLLPVCSRPAARSSRPDRRPRPWFAAAGARATRRHRAGWWPPVGCSPAPQVSP